MQKEKTQKENEKLEIKNIKIKYEETEESFKKYNVTYELKNKRYQVFRRYNDFKFFRKALRKQNPFFFIQPLHPKMSIVILKEKKRF